MLKAEPLNTEPDVHPGDASGSLFAAAGRPDELPWDARIRNERERFSPKNRSAFDLSGRAVYIRSRLYS